MLGDLAVAHAHDVDGLELNFAARRRHAEEFSPVRAVIGLVRRHAVAIGELPMDVGVKVGERGAEHSVELPRAGLVGRAARLRRVVEKVVGEEFLEHCEIPAALHFLGVAANDCLRGFAELLVVMTCSNGLRFVVGRGAPGYAPAPAFWPSSCSSQANAMPLPPPCSSEDFGEAPCRGPARPVALQFARHRHPGDRNDAGHHHAADRHLVRFGAHAARGVGDRIDLVAFARGLDRRHREADLRPERRHDQLLAAGLLHRVDDARVFPGVDEGAVDRLLIGEHVLQALDELAAAILQHGGQDRRHVENLGRLRQRR